MSKEHGDKIRLSRLANLEAIPGPFGGVSGRRNFLFAASGGALLSAALAQVPRQGRMAHVGYLDVATSQAGPRYRQAFEASMRELGYEPGVNLQVSVRTASRSLEELQQQARQLVELSPDVVVASSNAAISALLRVTTTIPIVMAAARDPVGAGLVASLARPGANVTGLNAIAGIHLGNKRLAITREILPAVSRIAILYEPSGSSKSLLVQLRDAATALGIALVVFRVSSLDDLDRAFGAIARERCDALALEGASLLVANAPRIADFAIRNRMLSSYGLRETTEAGLLFSYGLSLIDNFRRTAPYVDKILRGARPGDLPVEQASKFELVINLKTARAIGVTIPQSVLLRADELID